MSQVVYIYIYVLVYHKEERLYIYILNAELCQIFNKSQVFFFVGERFRLHKPGQKTKLEKLKEAFPVLAFVLVCWENLSKNPSSGDQNAISLYPFPKTLMIWKVGNCDNMPFLKLTTPLTPSNLLSKTFCGHCCPLGLPCSSSSAEATAVQAS